MSEEGFDLLHGEHAIVPVMFGDAAVAARVADRMLTHGVYVTAFSYPVVPSGAARIRVQLSAAHSTTTSRLAFARLWRPGTLWRPEARPSDPSDCDLDHITKSACRSIMIPSALPLLIGNWGQNQEAL